MLVFFDGFAEAGSSVSGNLPCQLRYWDQWALVTPHCHHPCDLQHYKTPLLKLSLANGILLTRTVAVNSGNDAPFAWLHVHKLHARWAKIRMKDLKPVCSFLPHVSTRVFRLVAYHCVLKFRWHGIGFERGICYPRKQISCGRHCVMRKAGIGSSSQETEINLAITFAMSLSVTVRVKRRECMYIYWVFITLTVKLERKFDFGSKSIRNFLDSWLEIVQKGDG